MTKITNSRKELERRYEESKALVTRFEHDLDRALKKHNEYEEEIRWATKKQKEHDERYKKLCEEHELLEKSFKEEQKKADAALQRTIELQTQFEDKKANTSLVV